MDIDTEIQEHSILEATTADQDIHEKRQGDSFFDQWLGARGEALSSFVSAIEADLLAYERATRLRRRARRGQDAQKHSNAVALVVCNLVREVIDPSETGRIAVQRAKRAFGSRYDNREALNANTFPRLLDSLEGAGLLRQSIGEVTSGRSTIEPTEAFAQRTQEAGITLADFGRLPKEELIVLRVRHAWLGETGMESRKDEVDYEDTPRTRAVREEMRSVNAFLERANIDFIPDGLLPEVKPLDRKLVRYFIRFPNRPDAFDQGGRLFGGFWQNLGRDRRKNIRIEGERVVLLDFKSMFLRLAYARLNIEVPKGDLYDLTGHLRGFDLSQHRDITKEATNALFFGGGKRWPRRDKKTADGGAPKTFAQLMPRGTSYPKFVEAVKSKHPALERLIGTSVGHRLMFWESQVLLKTLRLLRDQDIVALGLHDGILVQASKESEAKDAMRRASEQVVGVPLGLSRKDLT